MLFLRITAHFPIPPPPAGRKQIDETGWGWGDFMKTLAPIKKSQPLKLRLAFLDF